MPVEPRVMDVLVALCTHAGDVLSADDLLHLCWDRSVVGENQVHKAIAQLRRILGDSASNPRYIENIRKRGYRTVAAVRALPGPLETVSAGSWSHASPFVGLDPFGETHATVFFGRDAAIGKLRDMGRAGSDWPRARARIRPERQWQNVPRPGWIVAGIATLQPGLATRQHHDAGFGRCRRDATDDGNRQRTAGPGSQQQRPSRGDRPPRASARL